MTTGTSLSPSAKRPTRALSWIIGIIAAVLIFLPMLVGIYTDWLWFGDLEFRGVFTITYVTRIVLFFVFGLIAAGITFLAAYFTWRGRPKDMDAFDVNSPVAQYRQNIEKSVRGLLVFLPIVIGVIAGFIGQGTWRSVLMFINGGEFGETDPQFGRDYGFYAFTLPVLQIVASTLGLLLIIAFLIALVGHYLLGSIRIGNRAAGVQGNVSKPARIQLAVTAGLWMLVQVFTYWLERYGLLYTEHDIFTGGGYTDINAVLPAKIILMVIAVVVAAAFFFSIVYKDLRVPGLAVVLLVLSAVVLGTVWPLIVEQFSVQPNRQAKEAEYIGRNIEATRYAYGVTDEEVTYLEDWGAGPVDDDVVANDENTINNLRLLDPDILSPTFTQMQQLRNFYGFPEQLQMDRYEVDGEMRDYVVAARELDPNSLRENQLDWINRHTVYTHGNGIVAAQANTVDEAPQDAGSTRGGFPVFTVSDLQSQENEEAEELGIVVDEPRVYFGPVIASATDGNDYAVVGDVGLGPVEYDTDTSTYTYNGEGGVDIGNWINRIAYALKYQEINLILSDRVGGESKILYDRDPRERVERVAPWLTADSETYPAVIDGRIKWIVDGYTTLSELPYSEQTSLSDTTQDTLNPDGTTQRLINDQVGYIRNSVKATVDAYDGTVELYEFDTEDPVLDAWMGVFPDTVNPESEISDELREHFRYPMDLYRVQREILARYHVDDPQVFFSNDAFWSVPGDPTAAGDQQDLPQPPHYVVAADPQNPEETSFQLVTPYRGLQREFLSAHMTVTSDPHNYGDITVRVLPTNTQTQGPRQAQDAMLSSDQVARDRTLWEGTNDLFYGNLLTLPVGGGEILYVEPIYSQRSDQDSAFPKLLRMLVSYKGRVGYAPTIGEALEQVGIDSAAAQEVVGEPTTAGSATDPSNIDADVPEGDEAPLEDEEATGDDDAETTGPTPPAGGSGAEGEAIENINEALRGLEEAQNGSFEEYGRALDELDDAVAEYQNMVGNN
ncbi:membrane protein [Corynebacterium yudongzhengii]|uniref:UPF0182 protein DF222_09255 n=1 Tax=Corynebacterium yudongzhengii TaxID=2080740 RepID=A0A2U1T4Y7_9CORY|nr:UPF0182 family protein [Corynebacterium yudongzhengii]AWB81435.1 membrane protein [Corynebacterium yudongzhengii]PWC01067.1 membrane protein [Corynebacterium yudongzhengii]